MSSTGHGRPPTSSPRPAFLITIDTEGDDLWSAPREITTRNAAFLPRFQTLCERHGLKPTWLTNYEMAVSPVFREFAVDVLRRGTGEIGMHLHAWNSPPLSPLTSDDFRYQPYLMEYPPGVIREKIGSLTALLEGTFGIKMVSHRAGRWGMTPTYARELVAHGYTIDCSVTPHVSWQLAKGDPAEVGGSDYTRFPSDPYFVNLEDLSTPGDSPLLEVPMSIMPTGSGPIQRVVRALPRRSLAGRMAHYLFPPVAWLRPNGRNLRQMQRLLIEILREGRPYAEFMLHSSELMPGGSPTFRTEASIEALYGDLEELFAGVSEAFVGETLREFGQRYR